MPGFRNPQPGASEMPRENPEAEGPTVTCEEWIALKAAFFSGLDPIPVSVPCTMHLLIQICQSGVWVSFDSHCAYL